jgi:hypothetical protein
MAIDASPAFSNPFSIPSGQCLCGCGEPANKRFVMGHDGRLRGRLVRVARDESDPHRPEAIEALRRLDWLHFVTPAKPVEPASPMAETRQATLAACRDALAKHCPGYREVIKDELFQVGPITVRPKGTGTKDGEWIWDVRPGERIESKESFYLLHDVIEPDIFYIAPSEYVRGALEGAHHRWYQEGRQVDEDGDIVNYRTLDSTTRRLGKWPVAQYENAWALLSTGQFVSKTGREPKPIRDTETGKEYKSEGEAGRDLYHLVGGDPKNTFVWFKIQRTFPHRFQTKNAEGDWVHLDDPSAPRGSTQPEA